MVTNEVFWFLVGGFCGVWFGYFIAALMKITDELERMDNESVDDLDPLINREKKEKKK